MKILIRKFFCMVIMVVLVILVFIVIFNVWVYYIEFLWMCDVCFSVDVVVIVLDVFGFII